MENILILFNCLDTDSKWIWIVTMKLFFKSDLFVKFFKIENILHHNLIHPLMFNNYLPFASSTIIIVPLTEINNVITLMINKNIFLLLHINPILISNIIIAPLYLFHIHFYWCFVCLHLSRKEHFILMFSWDARFLL